ncbi:hypothetical protein Cph01nite_35900 [Cellulomonas phragmiteti]|uniref:Uncharacterized protein n=1 Tax=Cellulomonas phragmiteti TaxID=478780 RepID=A0ABQ4DR46_9CELL|nr:hypothetical protein Cph01nite_35900 [Cellulomonas phragmiteti]
MSDTSSDVPLAEMLSEYHTEIEALEFPPGWTDPGPGEWETQTSENGGEITHVFEPGFGEVTAQSRWVCAWQSFWVDSGGTELATREVVTRLAGLEQMVYWEYSDEATRQRRREILEAIRSGNSEAVSQETQLNCLSSEPGS